MREEIKNIIIDKFLFGQRSVELDEHLFDNNIIDSLDFLELIGHLEDKYKVSVNRKEVSMTKFTTITNIADFLENKLRNE